MLHVVLKTYLILTRSRVNTITITNSKAAILAVFIKLVNVFI